MDGKYITTFDIWFACNIPLCLVKEINCFQKYGNFRSAYNIYFMYFLCSFSFGFYIFPQPL